MKYVKQALLAAKHWLTAYVLLAGIFIFFSWLAYPEAWHALSLLIIVLPLVIAAYPLIVTANKNKRIDEAITLFLNEPNEPHERQLLDLLPLADQKRLKVFMDAIQQKEDQMNQQQLELKQYKNYIEEWVHEIKKPLSLMTLVLENRSDQMSPLVLHRMTHSRNGIKSYVDQILYFARINTPHRDYQFEPIDLKTVCHLALNENASILQETTFTATVRGPSLQVFSDQKSLIFILSQLINNSVKYVTTEPKNLYFTTTQINTTATLTVMDNGNGVAQEDLPFIFDKAFTGQASSSTGMGLFLVKQLANDLTIDISAQSAPGQGLAITLSFPIHLIS